MKIALGIVAGIVLSAAIAPARAGDDAIITRLVTCQDSWYDMQKSDPAGLKKIADHIHATLTPHDNDPYSLPKSDTSILGLHVTQVYPQSVGMGVGFSVMVAAPFDKVRAALEKAIGKKLVHCEASDGMNSCDLTLSEKRNITVMAEDDTKAKQTLAGCYYFYEK